ncbi:MAG: DNA-binding protein [Chlorobium sp.]
MNDEMIVEYLKATAEDPNPEVFLEALSDVARAKGTTGDTFRRAIPQTTRTGFLLLSSYKKRINAHLIVLNHH